MWNTFSLGHFLSLDTELEFNETKQGGRHVYDVLFDERMLQPELMFRALEVEAALALADILWINF